MADDVTPKLSLKGLDARLVELFRMVETMHATFEELINALSVKVHAVEVVAKSNSEETSAALHEATSEFVELVNPRAESLSADLMIGLLEALRSIAIITTARMAEELEAKWYPDSVDQNWPQDFVVERFPWLKEYQ